MKASDAIERAYKDPVYLNNSSNRWAREDYLCNVLALLERRGVLERKDVNYVCHLIQEKIKGSFTLSIHLGLVNQTATAHYKVKAHEFWAAFVEELRSQNK